MLRRLASIGVHGCILAGLVLACTGCCSDPCGPAGLGLGLHAGCQGCGEERYIDEWISEPPTNEPCSTCGNYNGQSCHACRPVFSALRTPFGYAYDGCDSCSAGAPCDGSSCGSSCGSTCGGICGSGGGCDSCCDPIGGATCDGSCGQGGCGRVGLFAIDVIDGGCGAEPTCGCDACSGGFAATESTCGMESSVVHGGTSCNCGHHHDASAHHITHGHAAGEPTPLMDSAPSMEPTPATPIDASPTRVAPNHDADLQHAKPARTRKIYRARPEAKSISSKRPSLQD
jgi:hypothetical protein